MQKHKKINRCQLIEYIQNQNLTKKQILTYLRYIARKHKISIKKILAMLFGNSKQNMIFLIPTADLLEFIAGFVKTKHIKFILELSAGHGLIASAIFADLKDRKTEVKYIAVDKYLGFKQPLFYPVKKMSNNLALKLYSKIKSKKLILAFYPDYSLKFLLKKLQGYAKYFIYIGFPQNYHNIKRKVKIMEYEMDMLSIWNFIPHILEKNEIRYKNNLTLNKTKIQILLIQFL